MKRKWLLFSAAGIVCVVALFLALRPEQGDKPQALAQPRYIAAEGKLKSRPGAEMNVGSELTARIERMLVNTGEHVDKGQVIAVLASEDLSARLREAETALAVARARQSEVAAGSRSEEIKQAQATLQRAESEQALAGSELERTQQLFNDKFVSRARLDSAESAYQVASAHTAEAKEQLLLLQAGPRPETLALQRKRVSGAKAGILLARTMLDKAQVRSPISGTLIERYLDVGEVAMPEKPIALIADPARLRVNAEVDETDAGRLRVGDPVEIRAYAYPGRVFRGQVEEIADYVGIREIKPNNPAVNLGLKIIQVKIALLEATPLKLGMTVDVRITPAAGKK